jgi:hypothetical protein
VETPYDVARNNNKDRRGWREVCKLLRTCQEAYELP